jgi:DNA-directed DNA polymerase III alpha subunit
MHEKLEPILCVTRGILVYQEQVMQIVRELAGYSYGKADIVRRAMSKKKMDVMEKERVNFVYGNEDENITGCVKNGIDEKIANKIFDDMIDFAKYAFNKSHAAAYTIVTYQTAYLKKYYTVEFMAALMSMSIGNIPKVIEYKIDCEENGILVLPPSVNHSYSDFSIEDDKIRFPLSALKGVGFSVANNISYERDKNGKYVSFEDLVERLDTKNMNKKVAEALIKSGSLDSIIVNRATAMSNFEKVIESIQNTRKNNIQGQISFFDSNTINSYVTSVAPDIKEFSKDIILYMEKEILGFYISGHPLEKYKDIIKQKTNMSTIQIKEIKEDNMSLPQIEKTKINIIGMISKVKITTTKKNDMMAFLTIEDLFSHIDVIVFPKIYHSLSAEIAEDKIVYITGRLSVEEDDIENKIIAERIENIENIELEKKIYIRVADFENFEHKKEIEKLTDYTAKIKLYFYDEKTKKVFSKNQKINEDEDTINKLKNIVGDDNIRFA